MSYVPSPQDYTGEIAHIGNINSALIASSGSVFDANTGFNLMCLGRKAQEMTPTEIRTICSYTGSGVLKRIWLATYAFDVGVTFLKIRIDGVDVFGNDLTTNTSIGMANNGVALDMLFTAGGGQQAIYNTQCLGSNMFLTSGNMQMGGYIALDMPFNSSIEIILNSTRNTATPTPFPYTYWVQPFILASNIPRQISPLRLHCDTFRYDATTALFEYPWMSVASKGNGVYLKGMKFYVIGLSGHWWEGRHRIYSGGNGMLTPRAATGYADATFGQSLPYEAGATVLFQSAGFEDVVLSSYNAANQATAFGDAAGTLYNSAGTGAITSTTQWSAYRFFGINGEGMPFSPTRLTVTWTCGDPVPVVPQTGSVTVLGVMFYYA